MVSIWISLLKSSETVVLADEMKTHESSGNLLGQSRMRYWGKYSFRVRTAVILTLFILLTALAVGFAFRNVVSILLDNQTNLDLRDDAQEFVEQLESIPVPITPERAQAWNRHAATHELHHWFLRVFDQDEKLVWETISVPEAMVSNSLQNPFPPEFPPNSRSIFCPNLCLKPCFFFITYGALGRILWPKPCKLGNLEF